MGEELCEGLGQLGTDDLAIVDEQLLEEGLVGLPADVGWSLAVHALAVGAELERVAKGSLDLLETQLGSREPLLGLIDLVGDTPLLLFQELYRDGPGVVSAEQGSLLVA